MLSSGGVDSSVVMMLLKKRDNFLFPLFIDYGQLAAQSEWKSCKEICQYLELSPERIDIPDFWENDTKRDYRCIVGY